MIYVKIHKSSESFITAVCDNELIGKKFKEGKLVLNISESFYKGELVNETEVEDYLKKAINLNIVGKRSCDIALKLNFISKDNILMIEGIPHAQSVVF